MRIKQQIALTTIVAVLAIGVHRAQAGQPPPFARPAQPPVPAAPPVPQAPPKAVQPPMPAPPESFDLFEFAPLVPPSPLVPPAPFAAFDLLDQPAPPAARVFVGPLGRGPRALSEDQADDLYRQAQDLIDAGRYDRAIAQLDRLAAMSSSGRVDAALYWKAWALAKLGQRDDALTTLIDMEKRFADSRWFKDAKALEVEVRQASGQSVSPDAQNDDELKLLALNGLMRSDPDRAVQAIEKMLSGTSSIKVKSNALFVLSQSRSPRAREIFAGVAKGGSNPDLQLRAIRYLGAIGAAENQQILDDAYRSSTDLAVKRAILRAFMSSGNKARLLALAKTEPAPELRGDAVRQLGAMRASAELAELYQNEQSADVKKRILEALFVAAGDRPDALITLTRNEKDPTMRTMAIRHLGMTRQPEAAAALTSIYASDTNHDVRKAIINALFMQQNAKALVDLARAEKNPEMKKDIVSKLSVMKSKEAADYLLELLK